MYPPAAAAALPGPDWLRERRQRAAEALADTPLPTSEEEVWRYSRIADLDPGAYAPHTEPTAPGVPAEVARLLEALPGRAGTVVVVDGSVALAELDPAWAERGVRLGPLADDPGGQAALGSVATEPLDAFGLANDALSAQPVLLHVPAGVVVEGPVVVVDWVSAAGVATFPRLVVQAGPDSQVAVVDWQGSDDVAALVAPVVELAVGPAARVSHLTVQDRGPAVWQVASQVAAVAQDATLEAVQAGLGGDYARSRTDCRLVGRGATGDLLAAYFGRGAQMLDFRTFQDHLAPDTTSNLLFKGALDDTSQSVYTGLIHVGKDARGTNAFQTNRNIKLSDGAWAESVPNLEIENNDVRCSHASTVGPVDEDQRFYLESRGVPTELAERLLVAGFFEEVLARVPVPEVARLLALEVDRRLVAEPTEAAP